MCFSDVINHDDVVFRRGRYSCAVARLCRYIGVCAYKGDATLVAIVAYVGHVDWSAFECACAVVDGEC